MATFGTISKIAANMQLRVLASSMILTGLVLAIIFGGFFTLMTGRMEFLMFGLSIAGISVVTGFVVAFVAGFPVWYRAGSKIAENQWSPRRAALFAVIPGNLMGVLAIIFGYRAYSGDYGIFSDSFTVSGMVFGAVIFGCLSVFWLVQ